MHTKWRLILATTIVLVVIGISVLVWWWFKLKPYTQFRDATGLNWRYPKSLQVQTLAQSDRTANLVFKAAQPKSENKQFLLTAGYDDGLSKPVAIQHISSLDYMVAGVKGLFPDRYQNYKEVAFRKFNIRGHQAAELIFTFDNKNTQLQERLLLIAKDNGKVMNVTAQARHNNFDVLNKKYFEPIFKSVSF